MNRRLQQAFIAIAIIFAIVGCETDDVDKYGNGGSGDVIYGADLVIELPGNFSEKFPLESILCEIKTPLSGVKYIDALHELVDGKSVLILSEPLPVGTNLLRTVSFVGVLDDGTRSSTNTTVAMGCKISVDELISELHTKVYNQLYGLFGSGTKSDPYTIATSLNVAAISEMDNTKSLYFQQIDDIDFSAYYGHEYGFDGICPDYHKPFRGTFYVDSLESYTIRNLAVRKFTEEQETQSVDIGDATSAGLFGCVAGATIYNLVIEDPDLSGHEAVGGVAGFVLGVSCADSLRITRINNCHIKRTKGTHDNGNRIFGTSCVGGILGCVELEGAVSIHGCSVAEDVVLGVRSFANGGGYMGGILGAGGLLSTVSIDSCTNYAPIIGEGAGGFGGIAGTAQLIKLIGCTNKGEVTAKGSGTEYTIGTGGLIGGSTEATIITSTNTGAVTGERGVGGLIGSSAFEADGSADEENNGDETSGPLYGNIFVASSTNSGAVKGGYSVGGIAGEGQVSLAHCYNSGSVKHDTSTFSGEYSGDEYIGIGGLVGFASAIVAHGSHNSGDVSSSAKSSCCGGVTGNAEYFFLYGCCNLGLINGDRVGGIIGRTCDYGLLNYVVNYADVTTFDASSEGSGYHAGGLVGSLGEHLSVNEKWSAYVQDFRKDLTMAFLGGAAEGCFGKWGKKLKKGSKVEKFIACCGSLGELCELIDEAAMMTYGVLERNEKDEESDELCEKYSEFVKESVAENNADIKGEINKLLDGDTSNSKYKYRGELSLTNNTDIAKLSFDNLNKFIDKIDSGYSTEAGGEASSGMMTDLTINSFTDLGAISKDNARDALFMEAIDVAVKCALAIASAGATMGVEFAKASKKVIHAVKISMAIASFGSAAVVDAVKEGTADEENVLLINQGVNFGKVTDGNGLFGSIGDRIVIRNSLSAGVADNYAIATSSDSRNIDDSAILCIGKENQQPYSDKKYSSSKLDQVYGYGNGEDGTKSYSDLKSIFSTGSIWNGTGSWNSTQAGNDISLPYNSAYLIFM